MNGVRRASMGGQTHSTIVTLGADCCRAGSLKTLFHDLYS
jgi:hypothetical protein